VRTLPLRLSPIAGESLPGYLARYSHTFGLQPVDVFRALDLEDPASRTAGAGCYGVWLSPDQLARVSFVTGIDPDHLREMLLARYADRAFPRSSLNGPIRLRLEMLAREALIWRSRFCPRCLLEDRAWRLRWQLGWSVVCTRHREPLRDRCPRCDTLTRISLPRAWPRDHRGRQTDPTRCAHRIGGELCRAALAEVPAITVGEELVAAQRRIDALLEDGQQPTLAGEHIDPPSYLRDLRVLVNILYRRPRPEASTGICRRSCKPALDDPKVVAAVLPRALALTALPDPDTLAHALRELIDQHYDETGETPKRWTLRRASPRLAAALRRAVNESAWASPSSRLGFSARNHRRPDDLDPALEARHVPQLFWASDYDRELAELLALVDCATSAGRRFCSVILTRLLTPLDWAAAVRYLDLPDSFIHGGYNTTFARLRHADVFDELARRIKRIANQHANRGLIDYKQRRSHLATWTGIDACTWRLIQPEPLPPSRRWDRPRRRDRASVWLWCQLTSGHEHASPISLPHPELRHHYAFVRTVIPALRERLLLLGDILLTTPDGAFETMPARFAIAVRRQGHLPNAYYLFAVSPLIQQRVLAHTSAHTGVDIATITTPPSGSASPAAVAHARLLAGALLHEVALASPSAIASILKGDPGRVGDNHRAYRNTLARMPKLAAELEQLTRAIEAWDTPAPTPPSAPHHQRMHAIATTIKTRALELLSPLVGSDLAFRASMLACRTHTDLDWRDITSIHDRPAARPANTRTSIAYHRRADPEFDHLYLRLLDHARELQRAAGYANAHIDRGLIQRASAHPVPN
jgi:hypothetical protein